MSRSETSKRDADAGRASPGRAAYDIEHVRRDFPALDRQVYDKPLIYLDNAATTHKPRYVLDVQRRFYERTNSNVHRGVHRLSQEATEAFEGARDRLQRFVNAAERSEIIFTRGATEGVNLVAHSYGRTFVGAGDEVLLSEMEHHSNIVPWQMLCEHTGAKLVVIPIDDDGALLFDEVERLLSPRTKIVALTHTSNALGTVNPVRAVADLAHARGAVFVVDGAQAVPHGPVDVRALGADFFVFSGHKMYGPTGIGVLYGRAELLESMPPYQGGGDMIRSVTFAKTTYNDLPYRFEAGTPDIAGAIGLGAAADYLDGLGRSAVAAYEADLLAYATRRMEETPGVRIIGTAPKKAGVLSFLLEGAHPHDIGTILDREGIAIRTGHHCAQPVMDHFGVAATSRASLALYNRHAEIDALVEGLSRVREVLG